MSQRFKRSPGCRRLPKLALANLAIRANRKVGGFEGDVPAGQVRSPEETLSGFVPEALLKAQEKRDRRGAKRLKEGR